MKLKIIMGLAFCCLFGQIIQAQQLPIFNQYSENMYIINPAMTGSDNVTAITASYRHQWTGMPEAPRTITLGARTFFNKVNMGLGGYVIHDQTGPTSFTGGALSYAYHIKLSDEKSARRNRLAIGFNVSVLQYQLRGEDLTFARAGDPVDNGTNRTTVLPDFNFGICYYNDWMYLGIAASQLFGFKANFGGITTIQRAPHFHLNAGVKIALDANDVHFLAPTIWVKYAYSAPLSASFGLAYFWKRTFGIGVGYASDGSLSANVNLNILNTVRVGYTFNVGVTGLAQYLGTSHEILLSYVIKSHGNDWIFPGTAYKPTDKTKKEKKSKKGDDKGHL